MSRLGIVGGNILPRIPELLLSMNQGNMWPVLQSLSYIEEQILLRPKKNVKVGAN